MSLNGIINRQKNILISWLENKKHYTNLLFFLFSSIYLLLSLLIYSNVSSINPHRDIDSAGYEKQVISALPENALVHQPRGYPIFIKTVYNLFGHNDAALIWAQILLTLLSSFLVFCTTKRLWENNTALITFALFCTNIGYLTFAQFILAESLLTFFLVLFFERFLAFYQTQNLFALAMAGVSLGLSVLVKPAGMYFIFLLLPLVFLFTKRWEATLILIISFALPIMAYGPTKIMSLGSYNLHVWFASKVATDQYSFSNSSERNKHFFQEVEKRTKKDTFWQEAKKSPFVFVKTWTREMLKTHFGLFTTNLKLLIEPNLHGGAISFFTSPGTALVKIYNYATAGTQKSFLKKIGILEFIWNIFKYIFVLLGLTVLIRKRQWFLLTFFLSYIFYFTFVTGFDGCARYRTMFEFALLMLAGKGIAWMYVRIN